MIRRFDETPAKNQNYITRHGVYAIIINSKKLLITFQGPPHNEYELPGGGVGGKDASLGGAGAGAPEGEPPSFPVGALRGH